MRHGPAEDVAETGRDFDRVLTASGKTRVGRVAELLVASSEVPLVIHTSPLLRTRETASIVAQIAGCPEPAVVDALAPGHDARALLDTLLVTLPDDARVMLVGHEPDMSDLADHALRTPGTRDGTAALTGGFGGFEKAMVVIVAITGTGSSQRRTLARVLDPREMRFR
jgi:phosphohistidine phosphatase